MYYHSLFKSFLVKEGHVQKKLFLVVILTGTSTLPLLNQVMTDWRMSMGYFMPFILKCVQFLGDILEVPILK